MTEVNTWWQANCINKGGKEQWRAAFTPFLSTLKAQELPQGKLIIQEERPRSDVDYGYWLKRAFLRQEARSCLYDEERDSLEEGHIFWKEKNKKEEGPSLLPLTYKGHEKALFLDRDGVINIDKSYVFKFEDIEFFAGIEDIIALAKSRGHKVIVLTNQSGIGRGLYDESDVLKLHQEMGAYLKEKGGEVDGWYYSPFHPESSLERYKRSSYTRKPMPGMALKAAKDWNIDLSRSFMIGDKVSDILAYLDLETFLIKGNYELGGYSPQFKNHQELKEYLETC